LIPIDVCEKLNGIILSLLIAAAPIRLNSRTALLHLLDPHCSRER
jgi:hypothetical protein